jgi:hypothetical protein
LARPRPRRHICCRSLSRKPPPLHDEPPQPLRWTITRPPPNRHGSARSRRSTNASLWRKPPKGSGYARRSRSLCGGGSACRPSALVEDHFQDEGHDREDRERDQDIQNPDQDPHEMPLAPLAPSELVELVGLGHVPQLSARASRPACVSPTAIILPFAARRCRCRRRTAERAPAR